MKDAEDEYEASNLPDKFIRFISSAARRNVKMKTLEQNIEDLMENDLYVKSLKLKNL